VLLKKIPKRTVLFHPDEMGDMWHLMRSFSIKDGCFIKEFENKFKSFVSVDEAIAVSSGRFALCLILKGLGLKEGDGVLVSAYNYRGVPKALLASGFKPVFIDADEKTYQMDIGQIEGRIDSSVKAIIITHLFGQPSDIDRIKDIAAKYRLFIVEDAAQSLGTFYHERHTGGFCDAGFFSFSGTKTLNTSFGGVIVTNNTDLAQNIRGELNKYDFPTKRQLIKGRVTTNMYALLTQRSIYSFTQYPITLLLNIFQLDPLEVYKSMHNGGITDKKMKFSNVQALIGLRQLSQLDKLVSQRRSNAKKLFERLDFSISLQHVPSDCLPNYFMIALRAEDKFKVYRKLLLRGIDSNLRYADDCSGVSQNMDLPVSKALSESILTINLPFDLDDQEIAYIARAINELKVLLL